MVDYFALLGEVRRPWLDGDALKARFLELSAPCHPDHFHNASAEERARATSEFTTLNSAYQCLREPKDRLQHLLELETGARPANVHSVPDDAADMFLEIGKTLSETDAFLRNRGREGSPLLRAQLFTEGMEWNDRLTALQQTLASRVEAIADELKAMNPAWKPTAPSGEKQGATRQIGRLEVIQRTLSFLGRWQAQIQERIVRLATE
jgi:hypothetical protein